MIDFPISSNLVSSNPFVCFRVKVAPGETNASALARELARNIPEPFTVCTPKGHYTWQHHSDIPLRDLIAASGAYLVKYNVSP
jgi:hypothetical protein